MHALIEPQELLESLTDKQIAVLGLLCDHRSSKQIARALDIAPNTVDQRINSVRAKFGTHDRASTIREYQRLIQICGKSTYGSMVVEEEPLATLTGSRDEALSPVFTLHDAATFDGHWIRDAVPAPVSEVSLFWGRVARFELIVKLTLGMAVVLAVMVGIANGLNDLI